MLGRGAFGAASLACALVALTVAVGDASATTFCVPGFSAACPNSGGNKAVADLEKAMTLEASDGKADQILVAPGVYTEDESPGYFEPEPASSNPFTFELLGSDPLTITGAGTGSTVMTSAGTKNIYVVNLAYNNSRAVTMRDLAIRIPAGFPDKAVEGYGGAIQMQGDVLDNVDIVSRNGESAGVASAVGAGNVFRNGELRGEAGGSIGDGFHAGNAGGSLLVEDSTVRGASWALIASENGATLTARHVDEVGTRTYGAIAGGGTLNVENSRMTLDDGIGFFASAAATSTALNANHVTILNSGASSPALEVKKFGSDAGSAVLSVANSILRGFSSGYKAETTIGPGIGLVSIKARYSNLPPNGTSVNGNIDLSTGNINADPLLGADLSLPAGSPSIDAGDPGAGLVSDFAGAPRPVDGDGNGSAIRDQGAFEYQPPKPATPAPQAGPESSVADLEPPQTTIAKGPGKALAKGTAKFNFRSSEAGSTFVCKLDKRKVRGCKSPKTYSALKPGKHKFKVWAIDAADNKDPTPAKRKFTVPAPAA